MLTFLIAFACFYWYHTSGITIGYHRLLSHRSMRLPKWLEYLIVSGGYLALEGSPIFWVTTHRLHHRYSDQKGDPHSPLDGLWHAFISWMWKPKVIISAEESRMIGPDLYRDPLYRMLHCGHTHWDGILCLVLSVLFRVAIFALFGPVVLCANLLATAMAFLGPLLVNSFAHMEQFGYQTYRSGDGSRNVWFVAALSLGEGWHNNHHAFPQSARHGLKSSEIDPSWIAISLMEKLGLARDIRLPKNPEALSLERLDSGLPDSSGAAYDALESGTHAGEDPVASCQATPVFESHSTLDLEYSKQEPETHNPDITESSIKEQTVLEPAIRQ